MEPEKGVRGGGTGQGAEPGADRRAQAGKGTRGSRGGRGRGVRSPYPFQHLLQVVSKLHEQVDLPAGVAVHGVDLWKHRDP